MTTRTSTGFVAKILGPSAFEDIFKYGAINVYTGTQPDTADDPARGALIARITSDGGPWSHDSSAHGLRFERTGRFAMNASDQIWRLAGLASGQAGWWRLVANASDTGMYSVTLPRIDGAVGLEADNSDIQLVLPTLSLAVGVQIAITQWYYAIPPLGA